jgi:hypothetical protein
VTQAANRPSTSNLSDKSRIVYTLVRKVEVSRSLQRTVMFRSFSGP